MENVNAESENIKKNEPPKILQAGTEPPGF